MKRKLQASVANKKQTTKILNKVLLSEFDSTLKESCNAIKWDLSLGCRNGSIHVNQSIRCTAVTNIVKVLITQVMSDSL